MSIGLLGVLLLFRFSHCMGIRVLVNQNPLGSRDVGGARLTKPSGKVSLTDMTLCIRFNLKTLAGPGGRSNPLTIAEYFEEYKSAKAFEETYRLFWLKVSGRDSFIIFGHTNDPSKYAAFILLSRDKHGLRELFAANRWMHFCLSYRKSDGLVTAVWNGEVIGKAFGLTETEFSHDILSMIYVGRCQTESWSGCSNPESKYTDLNIWDRHLGEEELFDWTLPYAVGKVYWTGLWDEPNEGSFVDVNDGNKLLYENWRTSEPNGKDMENCAATYPNLLKWSDVPCEIELCGFCNFAEAPSFTLRGLCLDSNLDVKYSWTGQLTNNLYVLHGYSNSALTYEGDGKWVVNLYYSNSTSATVASEDYPFGEQVWTVTNDPCFGKGRVREVLLSLNACNGSEFNCKDGQCISMENRCDGVLNCDDKTDEIGCTIFEKDPSYIKTMPPKATGSNNATIVNLELDVLTILEIAEVESFIAMQIELSLSWFDSRLTMIDLNEDEAMNALSSTSRKELWYPEVVFYNTESKTDTLDDEKVLANVRRNGSYKRRNNTYLHNAYVYQGSENPIVMTRVYSDKFICEYNMRRYPFDKQKCSAIFVMKGKLDKFVNLIGKRANYLGPIDLAKYYIMSIEIVQASVPPGVNAVKVEISFGRRILSTFLSKYLPTFLICNMTFCTNYFKGFYFEAIVTVNLTSMLVLTTLSVSVFDSLPQTSYIKMIDIWLIFCLTIPFLAVIYQTCLERLRDITGRDGLVVVNTHGSLNVGVDERVRAKNKRTATNNQQSSQQGVPGGSRPNEAPAGRARQPPPDVRRLRRRARMRRALRLAGTWGMLAYSASFTLVYFALGLVWTLGH